MSHTSGPWEFRHVANLPLTIVDGAGGVIALVDRRAHRGGEGMANGHLLKSALDLLAACEYALQFSDDDHVRRILKAAIAMAKGETP